MTDIQVRSTQHTYFQINNEPTNPISFIEEKITTYLQSNRKLLVKQDNNKENNFHFYIYHNNHLCKYTSILQKPINKN